MTQLTGVVETARWRELQADFAELPEIGVWQVPHDFAFPEGVAPTAENLGRQILVDEPFWMFAGGGDAVQVEQFKGYAGVAARLLGKSRWSDWLDHVASSKLAYVSATSHRSSDGERALSGTGLRIDNVVAASVRVCKQYALGRQPRPIESADDIRDVLRVRSLTQAEWASRGGIDRSRVTRYLNGEALRPESRDSLATVIGLQGRDLPIKLKTQPNATKRT